MSQVNASADAIMQLRNAVGNYLNDRNAQELIDALSAVYGIPSTQVRVGIPAEFVVNPEEIECQKYATRMLLWAAQALPEYQTQVVKEIVSGSLLPSWGALDAKKAGGAYVHGASGGAIYLNENSDLFEILHEFSHHYLAYQKQRGRT